MSNSANILFLSVASVWEIQIKIMIGKFKLQDPFDRLLISQAIVENMTLVSADTQFANYPVNLLW
jgi:PIN domain nuclease of toxin-antitoxin system